MPEIEYDELQDILCHQTCYIELELGGESCYIASGGDE